LELAFDSEEHEVEKPKVALSPRVHPNHESDQIPGPGEAPLQLALEVTKKTLACQDVTTDVDHEQAGLPPSWGHREAQHLGRLKVQ